MRIYAHVAVAVVVRRTRTAHVPIILIPSTIPGSPHLPGRDIVHTKCSLLPIH